MSRYSSIPPIRLKCQVRSDCELVILKECSDSEFIWRIGGLILSLLIVYLDVQGFSSKIRLIFWVECEPQELNEQNMY